MRSFVALLVACSSPPQPVVQHATTAPPTIAPQVVRGGTYGLTTERMPAIATDGSRIVAAFRESDGDRGLPNLTVIVKDKSDREVERHVVVSIAEADAMVDDANGKNPQLDERIRRANAWIADQHAALRFEPMTLLVPESGHPADRKRATAGSIVVTWEPNRLRITDGPTVLVERETPKSWIPENTTVGTNVCLRSPYLGAAAIDRTRKLAVVTISTVTDSDFCLPATDALHVIVW